MTTKPTIQIGDEVREMTAKEIAQYEKDQAEFARQAQADADRQALRTATLAKLGLTADEVAALLS
jgi:predicted secreted Zn-dependent protease